MSQQQPTGKLYVNDSGRSSYEIFHAESSYLARFEAVLQVHFDFEPESSRFEGLDEIFQRFARDGVCLELGWDNWSGCYLQARSPEGDAAVAEIGEFMDQLLARTL